MADPDPVLAFIAAYQSAAADAAVAAACIAHVERTRGIHAAELKMGEQRFRRAVGAAKRCAYQLATVQPTTIAGAAALLRLVADQTGEDGFWPDTDDELVRVIIGNVAASLEAGAE
jgi:hypothetical protein